jgi:hypothetical protein
MEPAIVPTPGEKRLARMRETNKRRYHEDPVFREAHQARCRANYTKMKELAKLGAAQLANTQARG